MARVLICDPHEDVSTFLEHVVARLGHQPVSWAGGKPDHVDAAVIEPGGPEGRRLAQRLSADGVPVLLTSIFPPDDELLALTPSAYLVKPFSLASFERALGDALRRRPRTAATAE